VSRSPRRERESLREKEESEKEGDRDMGPIAPGMRGGRERKGCGWAL